jgi:hypothetical protein
LGIVRAGDLSHIRSLPVLTGCFAITRATEFTEQRYEEKAALESGYVIARSSRREFFASQISSSFLCELSELCVRQPCLLSAALGTRRSIATGRERGILCCFAGYDIVTLNFISASDLLPYMGTTGRCTPAARASIPSRSKVSPLTL